MSIGPTYYDPQICCIYCGASSVPLSDEHIVPLSLGGVHVLRNASCRSCSNITSKFELRVARGLWGEIRERYDAPSRRKKKRPQHVLLHDPANPQVKLQVLRTDAPAVIVFYAMSKAGLLLGYSQDFDGSLFWQLRVIGDRDRIPDFERKYGFKPRYTFTHYPYEFGQLLLKIGYGQILTQLERQDFDAICLPYILGQNKNVSWLVGSDDSNSKPMENVGYQMRTSVLFDWHSMLLIAHIKLWANVNMPWYHMIIGRVSGQLNIKHVINKLAGKSGVEIIQLNDINKLTFP